MLNFAASREVLIFRLNWIHLPTAPGLGRDFGGRASAPETPASLAASETTSVPWYVPQSRKTKQKGQ